MAGELRSNRQPIDDQNIRTGALIPRLRHRDDGVWRRQACGRLPMNCRQLANGSKRGGGIEGKGPLGGNVRGLCFVLEAQVDEGLVGSERKACYVAAKVKTRFQISSPGRGPKRVSQHRTSSSSGASGGRCRGREKGSDSPGADRAGPEAGGEQGKKAGQGASGSGGRAGAKLGFGAGARAADSFSLGVI